MSKTLQTQSSNCVIYIRCSTKYQVVEGRTIQNQIKMCSEYAEHRKLNIEGIYIDKGKSGRKLKGRKELFNALNKLSNGGYFIIYSISRASRSMQDLKDILIKIEQRGCKLLSVSENLEGDKSSVFLTLNLFSMLAEQESMTTGLRVKHVMASRKEELGSPNNRIRYGWKYETDYIDDKGKLIPIPVKEEQKIIKLIKELRNKSYKNPKFKTAKERLTPYSIVAEYLNEQKIPTRTRNEDGNYRKWHAQGIKNILDAEENMSLEMKEILEDYDFESDEEEEIPDEDDGYVYIIPKGIRRIGSGKTQMDIYNSLISNNGPKTIIYIYFCKNYTSRKSDLIAWLIYKKYVDIDDRDDTLIDDANFEEVLSKLKSLCDKDYTTVTLGEILKNNSTKK